MRCASPTTWKQTIPSADTGVIMTIISAGLLVPYAYVQGNGYGLFLFDGPDGWKLPAGILVWHLIYGYFLGALYQPKDD